jgi:hypothetical protein
MFGELACKKESKNLVDKTWADGKLTGRISASKLAVSQPTVHHKSASNAMTQSLGQKVIDTFACNARVYSQTHRMKKK